MSSPVSGGSSSRDENQKVRDTYREREQQLKEKQQAEISRINQAHADEVKRLQAQQGERDQQVSSSSSAAINRSDMRHQKDIAKLRMAHANQIRSKNAQHRDWKEQAARDYRAQSSRNDASQGARLRQMENQNMNRELESAERTQSTMDNYRQRHQEEVQNIQRDTRNAYQEKRNADESRHYQDRTEMAEKHENFKSYKNAEIRKLKRDQRSELDRKDRIHKQNMDHKDLEFTETYGDLREEQQIGHEKTQQRYAKALEEERESLAAAKEKLYGNGGRLETERERKNAKIRDLRMQNQKNLGRVNRQKKRELANQQEAHNKTLDVMFDERQGMVREYNKTNHSEINAANERADKKIEEGFNRFSAKAKDQDEKNNRDLARQRKTLIDQNNDKIEKNKMRNEAVRAENATERYRLKSMHENQVQRLKNHHASIINEERYKNSKERESLRERFTQRVKELEVAYGQKLAEAEDLHKQERIEMQNQNQKRVAEAVEEKDRVIIENQRAAEFQEKNREKKYEFTLSKVREGHREEMRMLNAQYRENLRNLIRDRDSGLT